MKKLFSIFLLAFVANHASDPVGVAAGGASSGVAVKVREQKNEVPFSQLSPEEKARLRKENQERVKNKFATKQDRTTNLVIVNDYSEINSEKESGAMKKNIKEALSKEQLVLCTKSAFLATQKTNKSFFVPQGYVCKQVNDDYLLFVPAKMQHSDQPAHVQNELVGLNFSGLPDYDYNVVDQNEINVVTTKSLSVTPDVSGKILLDALQQLKIKDVLSELLPYFNIYFTGHGGSGVIADISARSKGPNEPSDFLKILQFFDKNLRMKSLGLFTCYIGGKQNIDAYKMYDQEGKPVFNKYDNAFLENLSYSIINSGSLHQFTYATEGIVEYFAYLNNPNGPKYQELLQHMRKGSIDNWMSIKLPHTSWFSPVELKNKTETLSQVAMSTQETPVDIKKSTEVIILQANYVPQPVIVNSFNKTSFMPVNYHDQSYYFKSLISIRSDTIFNALQSLIFSNVRVNEEINFAFERLQFGNIVYKNVHCFVSKFDSAQQATTGFVYEDDQGRVFKYTWPAQQPSDMAGKKTLDVELDDDSVKEEVIAKDVWDKEFKEISESAQKKVSEALQPDFINKIKKRLPVLQPKKIIVGKNLNEIEDQLSKKLLQPQDLEKIVPVLQKEMKSEDISVQKQVGNIFAGLIGKHVITSDNIKILQPLLIESFKDHVENVENEGLNFIRSLLINGIITVDNWRLLLSVLKLGSESDLFQTRSSIGGIINVFCLRSVIESFNDVKLFLEEGINDPDPKVRASYLKVIETLTKKALVTQTDIADFKKLTSYSDVQDAMDKLTEIAPKKLPESFSLKQSALFSSLTKKITDPDKSVRLTAIQKISALLNNNFITNMNIDQFLPIIEKGMLDSDKIIRLNVLVVLYRLISNKLITDANIEQLLSILQKCLSDSDKSIRLEGFNIFMAAIENGLITESNIHQFLPIIEKGVSDLDPDIRLKLLVMLDRAINKNVITNANIEKFLPTIQMCVSDSDKSVRLHAFDIFSNAITQRLITEANIDQFLPLIEKGLSDHDQRVRFKAFKIFGSATFKYKLITKVNIDRILLLIEKGIDSSSSYVNWLIEEFEKLINEDLIAETNIDQFLPLIEKVIKVSPEYERNGLLEMLIDKNLITAESARGLEPLVDDAELKAKLQNQYVNHELEQDKNLHRQELQKDEDRLDYQEQQERENRHRQAQLEHTRVVEVR